MNEHFPNNSLLDFYLDYSKETEPPSNYHRWCIILGVAAMLGRNFHLQFGSFKIHPNIYCMLVGESGSRKSTAIRSVRKLITAAGYTTVAADKTTKEKFLLDLQGDAEDLLDSGSARRSYDRATSENLWGSEAVHDGVPREILIAADEFNDFIGIGNVDFCSMLGQLWDYEGVYQSRVKNGRSVAIPDPTISILSGNTSQNIALAFQPELIGQGWFSRLLLIYGEKSGRKYTIPPMPSPVETSKLIFFLKEIQQKVRGSAEVTASAYQMLDSLYHEWTDLQDVRFRNYSTRRLTHLLKLVLIRAASRLSKQIEPADVVWANTVLSAAEHNMPKALGEFGRGKHSAVADKIVRMLTGTDKPLGIKDFWKECHKDLEKPQDLAVIIQSLEQAEKIFSVKDVSTQKNLGWLSKGVKVRNEKYVDWSLLTEEERKLIS